VWLNALAIETPSSEGQTDAPESIKESLNIPLDSYPLCEFKLRTIEFIGYLSTLVSCSHGQRHYYRR